MHAARGTATKASAGDAAGVGGGAGGRFRHQRRGEKASGAGAAAQAVVDEEEVAARARAAALAVRGREARKRAVQRARRGTSTRDATAVRTSTRFHRPATLKTERAPKYPRKSRASKPRLSELTLIKYPLTNEGVMRKIEEQNTLVFIVALRANKPQIRRAVKRVYDVDALKVNTLIRPDGLKKAYVRLTEDCDALEVANKIGIC